MEESIVVMQFWTIIQLFVINGTLMDIKRLLEDNVKF